MTTQFADEIAANLERAEQSLQAARQLASGGYYDFAASRAYYAAFYAAIHYRTLLHAYNANRFQHIEHNRNESLLIQEMLKQSQAQLEQTQIAAIRPMNDFDSVISHGQRA